MTLAMPSSGQAASLQLHQSRGSKANHLAQHADICAFRQKPTQGTLLVGHRGVLGSELRITTQPYPGSPP
jgi:hypothetical protein